MPRFWHIWLVRPGHELPAKMSVLRIVVVVQRKKKLVLLGNGKYLARRKFSYRALADPQICVKEQVIVLPPHNHCNTHTTLRQVKKIIEEI